jgi:transcriptional regulator with GAF, ATPase, and Fis domain
VGAPDQAPERIRPLRDVEREHLARALAHTEGKIYGEDGAAALLGLKPTTLQSRLRRLGLR